MPHAITRTVVTVEQNWLTELANATTDPVILLNQLEIPSKYWPKDHPDEPNFAAKEIMTKMMTKVSGYMVPKLSREIGGRPNKTPLDLNLE